MHRLLLTLLMTASVPLAALAQPAEEPVFAGSGVCGGFPPIDNGPHDYRSIRDNRLGKVERYHFTTNVERLVKGESTSVIGADISFTLRHFPNHHRALASMSKLAEREKTVQVNGSEYSVDCWFDRALRFARDDTVSRLLFADHLQRTKRPIAAAAQVDHAVTLADDNPLAHYNAGLIYLDLKRYEQARQQAYRAEELGLKWTGLRDRLRQVGQWREPAPPAPSTTASGSLPVPAATVSPASAASR